MKPDFIIIGAQKSASTYIQDCLREHPDIYLPEGESPYFETPDYETEGPQGLTLPIQGKWLRYGIRRPNYLGRPEVPSRIIHDLPNAQIIAVLRNPVDRAVSAYFHQMHAGTLPLIDIETGMHRILDDPQWRVRHPRSAEVLEFGLYAKYLKMYRHFIDRNLLLVLLYDDIKQQPLNEIQRVFRFLAVRDDIYPHSLRERPQQVIYNMHRLRILTLRNQFNYLYNHDRTRLHPRIKTPVEIVAVRTISFIDRNLLFFLFPNRRPKLSASLQKRLYEYYADDISELETLLNIDLRCWKK